jgi:transposase
MVPKVSDSNETVHRSSGKAIIATTRKFWGVLCQTLKNDWVFEDFPNFVVANI